MEHRRAGKSSLELPVVTFGAWAIGGLFWGGSDDKDALDAIRAAVDHGITAIDTAPMYGCGHSEELVGRALGPGRSNVKILTKCGLRWDDQSGEFYFRLDDTPYGTPVTVYKNVRADSIMFECEQSLKRLGTDHIDLYQVHWPSKTAPASETMAALTRLKEQGKILEFGVSNYNSTQMAEAAPFGGFVSNQVKYNLLERGIEKDALPYCRKHRIGVVAYSPMAMGLLTGKVDEKRQFSTSDTRATMPLFSASNRRRVLAALSRIQPIADRHGANVAQLAVAWVLAQPGITTALVGARNARQVSENVRAADIKLSEEETAEIAKAFAG